MNKRITMVLLALICMATPVVAQPTPFAISGHVFDADSNPCNGSWVRITNLDTGSVWHAENNSSSNYYQLVISSDHVNATEELQFNTSGCSQFNTTQHTVTQNDINSGGLVRFNITLEPVIVSCDSAGNEKNQFAPSETVYTKGTGLSANTDYSLWIQDEPVCEGYTLCAANCTYGDGANKTVTTYPNGSFAVTQLWDIPEGASPTYDEYDIVADRHGTGQGTYNAESDGIDSATVAGIVAPVPELASIVLFAAGLVVLLGFITLRRKKKE